MEAEEVPIRRLGSLENCTRGF